MNFRWLGTDTETAEYQALCAVLGELQEKYQRRKQELRRLLEKAADLRRKVLLALLKENHLIRHLTGGQRKTAGLAYNLGEIQMRIKKQSPLVFQGIGEDGDYLPEPKQTGRMILGLIDTIKKRLLQFDLLELRCREILLSIEKALEAFRYESRIIHRKIYPLGIISVFYRKLRGLWGSAYFTLRDMESITALGTITGHVLKIADSPVF